MPQLSAENKIAFFIGTLQALLKGFSVFYLLLLPILYALGVIGGEALGIVGALLISGMALGGLAVSYWLHAYSKISVFQVSLCIIFVASILLFWPQNIVLLSIAYLSIGIASGFAMSTISALAGQFTTRGARYGAFAKMAMYTDVVRMIYPIIAGIIFATFKFTGLVYFILLAVVCVAAFIYILTRNYAVDAHVVDEPDAPSVPIRDNKPFWYAVFVEFFDAIASSQLFVFLPTLLIFKNFSIENALVMQSAVFFGYLSGRWFVGHLASKVGGYIAVGIAEIGMIVAVVLLLVVPPSVILYGLCFLLGVFTRGTSPVIKALVLDSLQPTQIRRGSAIYLTIGEAGSALAQLSFGFLLAWYGAVSPFIASIIFAFLVAVACFARRQR